MSSVLYLRVYVLAILYADVHTAHKFFVSLQMMAGRAVTSNNKEKKGNKAPALVLSVGLVLASFFTQILRSEMNLGFSVCFVTSLCGENN